MRSIKKQKKLYDYTGVGIGTGAGIGLILGQMMGNLSVGLIVGAALGVIYEMFLKTDKRKG